MAFIIHLPMFIPANHSRAKCAPCSTSPPAAGNSGPPQRAPCSVPWHQPGSCSVVSLRGQELSHSANSRGLRNSGCASGFDYVWTSSFTIDNCHSLEMFLPSCALGKKKKKRKKINKLFFVVCFSCCWHLRGLEAGDTGHNREENRPAFRDWLTF